jgi:FixJ family two-component response regulator
MGGPKKVFILDDDTNFLKETAALLSESGYEVETCQQPTHSFTRIKLFEPDCLLLDVRMPLFDGRAMLPWLRRQWPLLPIVMITGINDLSLNEFVRQGIFCVLEKPFTSHILIQAIEHSIMHTPYRGAA